MSEFLVYDNIVKIARSKGISINSIEKEANLARGSVCKWNSISPSVRSLKKVAIILGCTLDALCYFQDKETENDRNNHNGSNHG